MRTSRTFIRLLFAMLAPIVMSDGAYAWNTPQAVIGGSRYTAWTWVGTAGDGNWNTGSNWCGAYVSGACQGQSGPPTSTAMVVFNSLCGANCNATLPGGSVTIKGLQLQSDYTGTITQSSTTLTIGTSGLTMYGGTFVGGGADLVVNSGNVVLGGGSFTAPSTNFTMNGTAPTVDLRGLTSFNANGGTFYINALAITTQFYPGNSGFVFHDAKFMINASKTINFNSNFTMDGNLTYGANFTGSSTNISYFTGSSIILTQGNVTHVGDNIRGSTNIKFTGTGLQTYDNSGVNNSNYTVPGIEVASSGASGSVKFIGTNVNVFGSFIMNASLGTLNFNGAVFSITAYGGSQLDAANLISPSNPFTQLSVVGVTGAYFQVGTVPISGNLVLDDSSGGLQLGVNGAGLLKVGGNVTVTGTGTNAISGVSSVVATIELNGTGSQSVSVSGEPSATLPGLKINKASGTLTFAGTPYVVGSFTYTTGSVTMPADFGFLATSNVTITNNGLAFNNVHLASNALSVTTLADDMTVSGNLYFENAATLGRLSGNRIIVSGNLNATVAGTGYTASGTPTSIKMVGASKSIDFSLGALASIPSLELAGSGTTTITGSMYINGNFISTSGTVNASASTLKFNGSGTTITPGSIAFNNVDITTSNTLAITAPMQVNGALTVNTNFAGGKPINGEIDAYSSVAFTGNGATGSMTLFLKGNASTFTATGTAFPTGTVTVAKIAGQVVTLASSVTLNAGQNLTVSNGGLDIGSAAQTLTIPGSLTIASGKTVKLSGGTLIVAGSTIPAGAYSSGTVVP